MQKRLESGWGALFSAVVVCGLAVSGLSFGQWRGMTALALLSTAAMLFHPRLRHFILLPSALALTSGLMLMINGAGGWQIMP